MWVPFLRPYQAVLYWMMGHNPYDEIPYTLKAFPLSCVHKINIEKIRNFLPEHSNAFPEACRDSWNEHVCLDCQKQLCGITSPIAHGRNFEKSTRLKVRWNIAWWHINLSYVLLHCPFREKFQKRAEMETIFGATSSFFSQDWVKIKTPSVIFFRADCILNWKLSFGKHPWQKLRRLMQEKCLAGRRLIWVAKSSQKFGRQFYFGWITVNE